MSYTVKAVASKAKEGISTIGKNEVAFGVTKGNTLPSPADLLVSAFAACCLKNVERFSEFMKYEYTHAEIDVTAIRQDKPPMMNEINFTLTIHTNGEAINTDLLLRNLQKFGTIYNTLNAVCEINGDVKVVG